MNEKINTHIDYTLDGVEYPSVTTILKLLNKDGLQFWANMLGFKRIRVSDALEQSARIGTYVHYLCECKLMNYSYIKYDAKLGYLKEVGKRYTQFLKFLNSYEVDTIFCEKSMISSQLKYAGTIDFCGYIDGKLTLLDFKTSKAFYDSMWYQLSAYNELLKEENIHVEQVAILLLHDDKYKIKIIQVDEIEKYWKVFKSLISLYYLLGDIK